MKFVRLLALCGAFLSATCSGGSPSTPTSASPAAPSATVTITNFTVTAEVSGSNRSYRTSFTMNETGGRSAAIINTIRFTIGSGVADANPTSQLRIAAGGTASSGTININDTLSASVPTSISVAVGYADDSGRTNSVSSSATVTQPPAAPPAPARITVAGVITDATTGRPIAGATVTGVNVLVNTNARSTTDGNGYYSLASIAGGEFVTIDWTASGYVSQSTREIFTQDTRRDIRLTPQAPPGNPFRIGATCNDGTTSDATGSGACSSHGGVRCWRYSDNVCRPS